jgi:predicted dehydrogenase
MRPVRIGVVGFGTGGLNFHSPFIEAADGVELAGVVTRSPERRRLLADRFPGVPAYDSLADLAAGERAGAGLDAVTITTPPQTRKALVLESLELGLHVVADKPFAPTAPDAAALDRAARDAGLILGVYHNRRWDSDVRTLRALLDSGVLGRVTRFHSRFDADDPATLEGGPHGGLLRDIGSHVVDQALWLFGPVEQVFARLVEAPTAAGPTDASFLLVLIHRDGTTSEVSSSKLNHLDERELRVYGENGSYVSRSTDVQAESIFAGLRPVDDPAGWGHEPESVWGTLRTAEGARQVPAEQGSYVRYYEQFAEAVRTGGPPPVSAAEAVETLAVLDAARLSAATGQLVAPVRVPPPPEGGAGSPV